MKRNWGAWSAAALLALNLSACGGSTMSNRAGVATDGNRTASDNWGGSRDGTLTGGTNGTASDNWNGTNTGTASDNWNGTNNGTTSDNWGGTNNGTASDNWNGTDNHRTAAENWNDTAAGDDAGKRSVTERASDALEDGVRRARDGVDNARESMNR